MTKRTSRRREQRELAAALRAEGKAWVEISEVMRERYGVNARVGMRLAHGWSQQQAADEWSKRWPDDLKTAKNFSYWETWPESGHAPSLTVIIRLAVLYGCTAGELVADLRGSTSGGSAEHSK